MLKNIEFVSTKEVSMPKTKAIDVITITNGDLPEGKSPPTGYSAYFDGSFYRLSRNKVYRWNGYEWVLSSKPYYEVKMRISRGKRFDYSNL